MAIARATPPQHCRARACVAQRRAALQHGVVAVRAHRGAAGLRQRRRAARPAAQRLRVRVLHLRPITGRTPRVAGARTIDPVAEARASKPAAGRAVPARPAHAARHAAPRGWAEQSGARLEPLAGAGRALHAVELLERRRSRLRSSVANVCKALRQAHVSLSVLAYRTRTSQQETQDRSFEAATQSACVLSALLARACRVRRRPPARCAPTCTSSLSGRMLLWQPRRAGRAAPAGRHRVRRQQK